MLEYELCFRYLLKTCWQSSIYLRAVWKQFLCHNYVFSVWIAEWNSHGLLLTRCPGSSCHLWGECNSTAGAQRFAFCYGRMENAFNGTVKGVFLYQKCPELKGWSPEVYLHFMLSCVWIWNLFIYFKCMQVYLPSWQLFSFPWCFAVVSWEDRHWDHFPVVSGCLWYSSASFCCK